MHELYTLESVVVTRTMPTTTGSQLEEELARKEDERERRQPADTLFHLVRQKNIPAKGN